MESFLYAMQRGGNMVLRWAELYEKMYQSDDHDTPY